MLKVVCVVCCRVEDDRERAAAGVPYAARGDDADNLLSDGVCALLPADLHGLPAPEVRRNAQLHLSQPARLLLCPVLQRSHQEPGYVEHHYYSPNNMYVPKSIY